MKRELRQLIRSRLANVTKEQLKRQSENISKALRALPEYQKATNIAYYLHMDQGEIETSTMINNAFEDKKRVFLPKIVKLSGTQQFAKQRSELEMLEVCSSQEIDSLQPHGKYNLREPESGTNCFEAGGLDMIVLPGMGFTSRCERIGHGRGYYDSFISRCEEYKSNQTTAHKPFLVAVGATQQLVDSIPTEPHDKILDAVIIDDQLFRRNE